MSVNNGRVRKTWRIARARERKTFNDMYLLELLPKARKRSAETGLGVGGVVLSIMDEDPRWVHYDDRPWANGSRPN